MARCIPDRLHAVQFDEAEAELLERLRFELSDEYIVIPCLEVPRQRGAIDSEADFVILHPRGRLVLEVKGGEIGCQGGRWYRVRKGHRESIAPPFYQARDNSYEIREYLERLCGRESVEARMPFNQAMVFTDVDFNAQTFECPKERIVDRAELAVHTLAEIVGRLLDDGEARFRRHFPDRELPAPAKDAQLLGVAQLLRPDLRLTSNLSATDMDLELIRLSASQLNALDLVKKNKRLRITGGPGSGKTLLAVETCRRERAATPFAKIGLLCFNRHLGAHLTDVAAREGLTTVRAGSFYAHIDQVLGDVSDAAATDPAYFRARVQRATEVAQAWPLEAKFDLLVIDEGQDLRDDASKLAFMDAILKGGLKDGRWWWFEDLDQILSPEESVLPSAAGQALFALLDDAPEAVVERNWRNTEQIARAAAKVMGRPAHEGSGISGPAVTTAAYQPGKELATLEAMMQHVVLHQQGPEDIVVLSARGASKECYAGQATLAGLRLVPFDPSRPYVPGTLRTSTVFKFKGMESYAVVLADLDSLATERDRRKAYVGISRAKYALYILASPAAEQALR
jgi:hypothetical protein